MFDLVFYSAKDMLCIHFASESRTHNNNCGPKRLLIGEDRDQEQNYSYFKGTFL